MKIILNYFRRKTKNLMKMKIWLSTNVYTDTLTNVYEINYYYYQGNQIYG